MPTENLKDQSKRLIREDNLDEVFNLLRPCFPSETMENKAVIIQSSNWKRIQDETLLGILTAEQFNVEKNKIRSILLTLIDRLPDIDYENDLTLLELNDIGIISLVNCNRVSPYNSFKTFFKGHQKQPFQFYFIIGCPHQEPDSFAERLVYEVIEDVLVGEESAIDFVRGKELIQGIEVERVDIPLLPLGMDADKSQLKFKKEFGKRLARFNMTDVSLEDFVSTKAAQLPYNYFTFIYQIEADDWDDSTAPYLQWIIDTFKKNQVHQPTFLFYFVVNMENAYVQLHDGVMSELQKITTLNIDACTVIDKLMPIQSDDLSRWIRSYGERSQAKIDTVVKKFSSSLALQGKLKTDGTMDMTDVEQFQEKIYAHYITNGK
jgi:hypothetical protein